ncbi:MAG: hypothetical protein O7A69_15650 [SAR324 cluster bacterium]|nr:hypothetical protein [SAR324 cluster bacterium]MCZ6646585.1 hypothetical protein [SAR324 cluster bacterium]MCZ6730275.1 hypothetical protein [SAR324 cluster bacterium]MCZ6844171.1 hypothetical protein [SAR324 cluster bacterium]
MAEPEMICKACMSEVSQTGKMTCEACNEVVCVRCWRDHGGTCGFPDCKEAVAGR